MFIELTRSCTNTAVMINVLHIISYEPSKFSPENTTLVVTNDTDFHTVNVVEEYSEVTRRISNFISTV